MKVLVCGGRDYDDADSVCRELDEIHREHTNLTVIEGGAPGADRLARNWAKDHEAEGVKLIEEKAKWGDLTHPNALIRTRKDGTKYDARAGIRRNRTMLHYRPDVVIAFPGGKGTRNCVGLAKGMGVKIIEVGRER